MTRKQRKRKWIITVGFILAAGLFPTESSLGLSNPGPSGKTLLCGDDDGGFVEAAIRGECVVGQDCCSGYPEAACGQRAWVF